MNCKYCGKEMKPKGLSHQTFCSLNPDAKKINRSGENNPMYKKKGNNQFTKSCNEGKKHIISKETRDKISKANIGKKHSESTKKIISDKLKELHNKHLHPGWSHINSKQNRRSYPEEIFADMLENDLFFKSLTVEEKKPVGKYFLDFAILEYKCDIEIDGSQHIRNAESILHDNIRDEYMISEGWRVYRISAAEFLHDKDFVFKKLKDWLHTKNIISKYDIDTLKRKEKISKREINKEKYVKSQEKFISLIKNSNIDFSKQGWVNKVSLILGIKHQKVKKWMETIMPDFYKKYCFKRIVS